MIVSLRSAPRRMAFFSFTLIRAFPDKLLPERSCPDQSLSTMRLSGFCRRAEISGMSIALTSGCAAAWHASIAFLSGVGAGAATSFDAARGVGSTRADTVRVVATSAATRLLLFIWNSGGAPLPVCCGSTQSVWSHYLLCQSKAATASIRTMPPQQVQNRRRTSAIVGALADAILTTDKTPGER